MLFYRGIAVARSGAADLVAKIGSDGLKRGEGSWTMLAPDLKSQLYELWLRPTLTFTDTRPDGSDLTWVCACAEPDGALYYACRHNKTAEHDTPILIKFEAPLADVIVEFFTLSFSSAMQLPRSRFLSASSEVRSSDTPIAHGPWKETSESPYATSRCRTKPSSLHMQPTQW